MTYEGNQHRLRKRLELALPVRVLCRETIDHEWMELTRLSNVSPFGARFDISHPTEMGRLLLLVMPMPRLLRCYDFVEDMYRMWALVRHVKTHLPAAAEAKAHFEVGVAFVGKRLPASFGADPSIRYEIQSNDKDGLWTVHERLKDTGEAGKAVSGLRNNSHLETRFSLAVGVMVEAFDEKGEVSAREETVTENINRFGAAIFTSLEIERGRFVRLVSAQYRISVIAVVRARRKGKDGLTRLHLEFVDRQWPLEDVE